MKGSEFIKSLPEKDIPAREAAILAAVRNNDFVVDWTPIVTTSGDSNALFVVSADVLKIGEPADAVRVSCSQKLCQQIADELGCVLPTAKLSDEIWRQADLKIEPPTQRWYSPPEGDGTMGLTHRMLDFDAIVNRIIAGRSYNLVAGHHKDWINSRLLGTVMGQWTRPKQEPNSPSGCNYGWHTKSKLAIGQSQTMSGIRVYQPAAIAHSYNHADYSQMLRLVQRKCYLCQPGAVSGFGAEAPDVSYGEAGAPCALKGGGSGVTSLIDIYDMPKSGGDIVKLVSGEGVLLMRHPAMGGEPSADQPTQCNSFVPGKTCGAGSGGSGGGGGGVTPTPPPPPPPPPIPGEAAPVDSNAKAKAMMWLIAGGVGGYLLVRSLPTLIRRVRT